MLNPALQTAGPTSRTAANLTTGLVLRGGPITNVIAAPVSGQLWFLTQGSNANARLSYVDNDGSTDSVLVSNSAAPHTELGTAFPQDVQVDWAAGVYFVVANSGPSGSGAEILMGHINSGAAPTVVYMPPSTGDIIGTLQIDTVTHHLYVGKADASLAAGSTGILDFTYQAGTTTPLVLTPVSTNNGFLVTSNEQTAIPPDPNLGVPAFEPRAFALDHGTNTLFFVNERDGGLYTNEIYKVDETTGHVTALLEQTQFPVTTDGSAYPDGYITGVAVDPSAGLVYFTTHSQHPASDPSYSIATNQIYYIPESASGSSLATAVTLSGMPGSTASFFYPGDITIDVQNRVIYVASEQRGDGTNGDVFSADDSIFVFQLDASGHTASYVRTITPSPPFTQNGDNIADMTFDDIPKLSGLDGTFSDAVERGANVTLLNGQPTITDIDGDHLSSATIQITAGTFNANENSNSDDNLTVAAADRSFGSTVTSGTINTTNISYSYNASTETLTLTGYDTLAHYQLALSEIQYFATGHNPTDYGDNVSRTVTWTVSDGALGIPAGQQNSGTTSFTIDSINDAPVNHFGAALTGTEDTSFALAGISISDVDARPSAAAMSMTLSVTHGTLTLATNVAGGLTAGGVTGNGTGTIVLGGTQDAINATLAASDGLTYTPEADYNGSDTLHVVTSDGGATGTSSPQVLTGTDDATITINSVNHPPTTSDSSVTTNEDTSYAFQTSDFPFSDPNDSPANSLADVVIKSLPALGILSYDGNALTAADVAGAGFAISAADIAAGKLTYAPAQDDNGSGYASFQFAVQDDGGVAGGGADTSASHMMTIDVAAVNDAPVAHVPGGQLGAEDTNLVFSSANGNAITVSDVDANGGDETVTLSVSHGTLTLPNESNVSVTGDGTGSLQITGTIADINTVLEGLTYKGSLHYGGSDALTVDVDDEGNSGGSALSDQETIGITVTPTGFTGADATHDAPPGTSGADMFWFAPGGTYNVDGAAGNDLFYFGGGGMTNADQVDGGPGLDQLALQGDYWTTPLTLGAGVVNIESIYLMPGNDTRGGDTADNSYSYDIVANDANVAVGQQLTVDGSQLRAGENFTFDGSAETNGFFYIYAGQGTDTLTGGNGNDVFLFNAGTLGPSDHVDGGPGNDQLALRGDYDIVFGDQMTSIESLYLVSAHDRRLAGGGTDFTYNLTMNDANVAAGQQMTVDGSALHVAETLTFDASAETNGSYRVFGGAGNDSIIGSHGNDILVGEGGADSLTGGEGNDTFLYRNVSDSTPSSHDTITDFTSGDVIDLSVLDANTTKAGVQHFTFIGSNAFGHHAGELRAINTSGDSWTISADVNGDGVADLQIVVSVADHHPIAAGDFHL